MDKKKILSIIVLLIAVIAFMAIPNKNQTTPEEVNSTTASVTQIQIEESSSETEDENTTEEEEKKEFLGGIRIGTSNLIVLAVLGAIIGINKIKEIKAAKSQEKD